MSVFVRTSEDVSNHDQSWWYTVLYRNNGGEYRVAIKANHYRDSSYAKIETWGVGGWLFVSSLALEAWYDDPRLPSYTRKELVPDGLDLFRGIAFRLLRRYSSLFWDDLDVEVEDNTVAYA